MVQVEVLGRPLRIGHRLQPLVVVTRALGKETADDRVTGLAAEVAFFAILGIFPGLLALGGALGFAEAVLGRDVADRAQRVILGFLTTFLTERASGMADAVRALFEETNVALVSFAALGAVWSMWRAMRAVMRALAVVYDAEEHRSPLRVGLLALGLALVTLVVSAVMLAVFVLGPLFGGARALAGTVGLGEVFGALWEWLRLPLAFVVLLAWAATLFHVAPHRRSPLRSDLPGAILTGVLWLLFSVGLRLYLEVAGGVNQVLGVIGGVLTVLLWLYLLSLALLLGGELNGVLAQLRTGAETHSMGPRRR